jgi:autotransporter-associated beta strand protein
VIDIHNGAFFTTVAIAGATTHTTDRSFDMVSNGAGTVSIGTTSNDAGFAFGGVLASGTGAKTLQLRCGLNTGGDRHWMVINGAIVDPSGAATSVDVIFDTQGTGDSKLHLAAVNTFTGPMTMTQVDGTTAGTVFVGSTATGSSGAPINGSGQLQSGNYGNTISVGTLTALSFNSSADQIVGGIISGAGLLKKVGTGKLTLSAANTCTGATTITGGTLQLGNAGVTGSLATSSAITITSPGILAINRANTFLFGTDCVSVVSGTGGLTQAGSGTTIITSTQTYTGATTINAGTVKVTGTINASSAITVKSGGSLTGTGTVGAITMESGGSIGPSATATVPGTLTTGNVTFVAGSNYKVRLDGVAPSFDKINSSGTVNLASATLTIAAITNPLVGGIYTIVGAVTRSNEFTGLAEGASITAYGSTFTVNYTGTTVTLTCTVAYTAERFLPFFLP